MVLLKILFWIIFLTLLLIILTVGTLLFVFSVKIQVIGDYSPEYKRFWLKYGILKFKVYPEMFSEKAKAKRAKRMAFLKRHFKPLADKLFAKAKAMGKQKFEETKEKKSAEKDFNTAVEIREETMRISEEEKRLEKAIPKAEAKYEAAQAAEDAGEPWPNVVSEKEASKLDGIRDAYESADVYGTFDKVKDFLSGFSFDSIVALLAAVAKNTGHAVNKSTKRIVFKRLNIGLAVSGDDAAETALKYGRIAAVAYPSMGQITRAFTVHDVSLDMDPDYLAKKDRGELHVTVAVRPLFLVTPFAGLLPKLGKSGFKFYKEYKATKAGRAAEKAAREAEEEEQRRTERAERPRRRRPAEG